MRELNFADNDKFDRKEYADFLLNLINTSDQYKRSDESASYVIAVDSPWGTGKTYFFDMFKPYMESLGFHVIKYNAWKNDFWNNAYEPFLLEFLRSDLFEQLRLDESDAEIAKGLGKALCLVIKGLVTKPLRDAFGENNLSDIESAFAQSGNSFIKMLSDKIDSYRELQEIQEQQELIKKYLNELLSKHYPNQKLIFIIDELDRCNPLFAIQTLEFTKHFIDIENLVYIYSLDIEQLSQSIKTVYGQDMDSVGYICRFFDYLSKIPTANSRKFVESILKRRDFKEKKQLIAFALNLEEEFSLSLRDLNTIMQNYCIMYDVFLNKYPSQASEVYLFYLTIKYKFPKQYDQITSGDPAVIDEFEKNHEAFSKIYKLALAKNELSNTSGQVKLGKDSSSDPHVCIIKLTGNDLEVRKKLTNVRQLYRIEEESSFADILFVPDLRKWEDIKNLKLGEYIRKQLDLFTFPLNDSGLPQD